jgi:cyclophilin family peptidyl-prolyl cis-trans isomerase
MNKTSKWLSLVCFALLLISCGTSTGNTSASEAKISIITTEGEIIVALYNETPLHRDNFLKLVKNKVYDGVIFHRVIADFMIQAGDPETRTDRQKSKNKTATPQYTIPAEIRTPSIYHKKGALAAARLGDNENPLKASSGYQFYIVKGRKFTQEELDRMEASKIATYQKGENQDVDSLFIFSEKARTDYMQEGGTPHLDGNYTVFGEVVKGQEIVDQISEVSTSSSDRPLQEVRIIKMKRIR